MFDECFFNVPCILLYVSYFWRYNFVLKNKAAKRYIIFVQFPSVVLWVVWLCIYCKCIWWVCALTPCHPCGIHCPIWATPKTPVTPLLSVSLQFAQWHLGTNAEWCFIAFFPPSVTILISAVIWWGSLDRHQAVSHYAWTVAHFVYVSSSVDYPEEWVSV